MKLELTCTDKGPRHWNGDINGIQINLLRDHDKANWIYQFADALPKFLPDSVSLPVALAVHRVILVLLEEFPSVRETLETLQPGQWLALETRRPMLHIFSHETQPSVNAWKEKFTMASTPYSFDESTRIKLMLEAQ